MVAVAYMHRTCVLRVWIRRGLGFQLGERTTRHGASRGGALRARDARRARRAIQQPRVDAVVEENRGGEEVSEGAEERAARAMRA